MSLSLLSVSSTELSELYSSSTLNKNWSTFFVLIVFLIRCQLGLQFSIFKPIKSKGNFQDSVAVRSANVGLLFIYICAFQRNYILGRMI